MNQFQRPDISPLARPKRHWLRSVGRFVWEWRGGFFLLAFGLAAYAMSRDFNSRMRQEHRYTVGVVYGIHWTAKAGRFADARFWVAGKKYVLNANADALAGQPLVGRRFVVKYHPPNPSPYSVLYLDAPVPADFTDVPATGWARPPFAVPDEVLRVRD
jgi:hypothetical protein